MAEWKRYEVQFSKTAQKALDKLAEGIARRLIREANELSVNPRPHGYTKLVGTDNDYRIRVGDYRIIYSIEEDILVVLIIDVGPRKDIYRRR